jgi:hypothetical protein
MKTVQINVDIVPENQAEINSIRQCNTSMLNGYNYWQQQMNKDPFEKVKVPIYKGCPVKNGGCFCSGLCKEIIGYRDKLPNEN